MWPLLVLAFGAFVAQTSEYLPISLLPQMSRSFHVSEAAIGGLVTGYAWIAALTAVPLTMLTDRIERKSLFAMLLFIISAANLIAAISPSFYMLAVVRVMMALTHGIFWSILASFGIQAAPAMRPSRATAWVFSGISLAGVAGVPLANAIGQLAGWRASFGVFAAMGGIALLCAVRLLPSLPGNSQEHSVRGLPHRNVPLYGVALVTMLLVAAHFISYTYIVPVLERVAGVPTSKVATMLLLFGAAGIVGTAFAGWFGIRSSTMALLAAAGVVFSQACLLFETSTPAFTAIAMFSWGSSVSLLIIGLQSWVIELAPGEADAASSLYVGAFNLGIGGGAFLGSLALRTSGPKSVLWAGTVCGSVALLSFSLPLLTSKKACFLTNRDSV